MKIDIFSHVMPKKYMRGLYKYSDKFLTERKVQERRPALTDLHLRMQIMEEQPDVLQVLSVTMPPLEEIVNSKEAVELARIANDEMAEMVAKYPDKFIAAVANLPMNDVDDAIREAQRSVKELGFRGVQIYTSIRGKPLSSVEFFPLYQVMSELDFPIWIHPMRRSMVPDYPTEDVSYDQIFSIFGWPYDTTASMTRLVFAGVFEKFPTIKFITHHCGAMIPYFAERIVVHYDNGLERLGLDCFPGLLKHPIEYFRMFYADTALNGNTSALMCAYHFFGEDRLLFGSDAPYDVQQGALSVNQTLQAIEDMDVPELSKTKIYEDNARNLLRL
jgi:predicted TIM-barrel fold metal-dependent hydrolase